jgi:hypothetical protein
MQLSTRLPKRRTSHAPRPAERPAPYEPPPASPDGSSPPSARRAARRAGGPEDRALYACMCGFAFKAAVTTSVGCPHCGTEQAW